MALDCAASLFPYYVMGTLPGPLGVSSAAVPSAQGHPSPGLTAPEALGHGDFLGRRSCTLNMSSWSPCCRNACALLPACLLCTCWHSHSSFLRFQ